MIDGQQFPQAGQSRQVMAIDAMFRIASAPAARPCPVNGAWIEPEGDALRRLQRPRREENVCPSSRENRNMPGALAGLTHQRACSL